MPATSLPIPSRDQVGLDHLRRQGPRHEVPPIEQLRPPETAPNVLVMMIDDAGFGASSAFGGPCSTRMPNGWPPRACVSTGSTPPPCAPDPSGPPDRPEPPLGRDGGHHRDRHVCSGLQLDPAGQGSAAGRDPPAQRLQHRPVRKVPRGAGVGDEPDGSLLPMADRKWVRTLLRLRRRARPTSTTRPSMTGSRRWSRPRRPEEGYHFTEDMTDRAVVLGQQQKR